MTACCVAGNKLKDQQMFGRQVIMKLKPDSAAEFTRIADIEVIPLLRKQKGFRFETTLIAPERSEVIANSFWDTKEAAVAKEWSRERHS
jgi:heme-degrading monooxygenase HmoA